MFNILIRSAADLTGIDRMKTALSSLGTTLRSTAGQIGTALVSSATLNFARQITQKAADLDTFARRAGTTAEELQKLAAAAEAYQIPLELLTQSLGKLALYQARAAAGDKDALATLTALGLEAGKFASTGRADAFRDLAEGLTQIQDDGTRATLAVRIFGEAGLQLLPVLDQGKTGLLAMGEAAAVMSNQTVAELTKVNREIQAITRQAETFGGKLTAGAANLTATAGAKVSGFSLQVENVVELLNDLASGMDRNAAFTRFNQKGRDIETATAAVVANPLGLTQPATPAPPPAPPPLPKPSPLATLQEVRLGDRLAAIGGSIGNSTAAITHARDTATNTRDTVTALRDLTSLLSRQTPREPMWNDY